MISRTLAKANILRFANRFSTSNSVDGEEPKKSKSYYMPKEEKIEYLSPQQECSSHLSHFDCIITEPFSTSTSRG